MTDRTLTGSADLAALRFDDRGLVPVVAQDARDGAVLMVAWADREALEQIFETGLMHYWSRSRQALWQKGETSGNLQRVVSLHADCDGDTVLARVTMEGPACHTGEATCFGRVEPAGSQARPDGSEQPGGASPDTTLAELWGVLQSRARERPEGSYTTRLLADENLRLKKLGEETAELITALARGDDRVPEEAADLVYHLMVALAGAGGDWAEVLGELRRRRG